MAEGNPAAKPAASKHNWIAIFGWTIAAILFFVNIFKSIQLDELETKVHNLGETQSITNADTGNKTDYVYINFGAPVYEDVNSSQPLGTFYSKLSEEEFLKFLDDNNIVIRVPFDAQSAPSEENPLYRVIGEDFWVQVVSPKESEVPTT